VADLGIPEGIREVVGRRLDRLSETANTALATAAVIGRDFDLGTVSAATALDEDAVLAALDQAVSARLVEETGVGQYRFAHALVRSTLYEELRATRRARMHGTVARAVEQRRPDDTAALAHHFVQAGGAGDVDKALTYAQRAGDEAMAQLAHDRAVDYYRQALELLEGDPARDLSRCALGVSLGEAQRLSGDAAYRGTLLDAAALAQRLASVEQLTRAALANTRGFWSMAGEVDTERMAVVEAALAALGEQDSADRARLLAVLSAELMFTAEDVRRHALTDEAVAVARRVGDRLALADVLMWSVPANYVPWRMDVLLRQSDELMVLAASIDDPQRWGLANLWNFLAHVVTGDVGTADARFAVACRVADELGQPTLRWLVTSWTSFRLLLDGDLDEAERQLNAGFELGQRTGQPDAFTWYAGQLWVLLRERGELTSLLDTVRTEVEHNPGLPAWQGVLAVMHCLLDQHDEAQALVERLTPGGVLDVARDVMWLCTPASLLEIAEQTGDRARAAMLYEELLPYRHLVVHGGVTYLGSAERYLACGARTCGRLDDAVAHLEAAVAHEERMRARTWLGLACADLARTLRLRGAEGDAARAERLTERARALARETGSVSVERRAAGLFS
jgi:tetratricopeptide (TPR) repeat protein